MVERQIMDGVLVTNEAVRWAAMMRRKLLLFKVDFAKAYDCLNWKFLDSVLMQMNFTEKWWSWIWGCISSPSISVLVNGNPMKEFAMERGLRQGDLLSRFLFM